MKKILKLLTSVISFVLIVAVVYVCYVFFSYSRIEDNKSLAVSGAGNAETLKSGKEYTVATRNLGFGAYTADFTFFMDGGKESWARSAESVKNCIENATKETVACDPDFILFQEVDTNSTRSYHIDERQMITSALSEYSGVFAENYHSAFLMYPLTQPHGSSNSGMLTLSKYKVSSALRRSLPISESFSKFLDLDRCYSVSRIPVENGKELVLINVHLSAYGGSDEIRKAQMTMLFNEIKDDYEKGNYVVCGGDYNHDFTGTSTQKLNGGETVDFGWAQPFPDDLLPDCIVRADNYTDGKTEPTCRDCDIPYKEGNFTIIVDGFLVSKNVEITYLENVQTGFAYSDHNPVVMKFLLK